MFETIAIICNESGRSNEVGVDLDTVELNASGFRLISVEVNK